MENPLERIQIFQNLGYLESQGCLFWTQEVTCHPNIAQNFFIIRDGEIDTTIKGGEIDTTLHDASNMSLDPVLKGFINFGEHSLLSPYILHARALFI